MGLSLPAVVAAVAVTVGIALADAAVVVTVESEGRFVCFQRR